MRNETKGSRATTRTSRRTAPANAFTQGFLLKAARLAALPSADAPTLAGGGFWAGPWDLEPTPEPHPGLWAVVRRGEPLAHGHPAAFARHRADAALVAATLPALGAPNRIRLGDTAKCLGFPLHDGDVCFGHLARPEPRLAELLHAVRTVLRHPECLALAVQSLGSEELAVLGRALMRRIETE
jgi:hypothetical protein